MFFKKRVKGVMILEVTMTIPFFLIIFICMIFNIRLYTLQGYIHTALSVSAQESNRAMQVINALEMEEKGGQLPSLSQKMMFDEALTNYNGAYAYGDKSKEIYLQLDKISTDGVVSLVQYIYEQEMHRLLDDYLEKNIPEFVMKSSDIKVDSFEIENTSIGTKLDCYVTYKIHYPFKIIDDVEKTMHICTYLE